MPYQPDDSLSRHLQTSGVNLASMIEQVLELATAGGSPNRALYREMMVTVVRMAQADRNRWDAKIMLQTLREMENAFRALEPFKQRRKVTVFGSARTAIDHLMRAGNYSWEEKREIGLKSAGSPRPISVAAGETMIGGYTRARNGKVHFIMIDREVAFVLRDGWRHGDDLTVEDILASRMVSSPASPNPPTLSHSMTARGCRPE